MSAAIKRSSHSHFKVIHLLQKYSWVTVQRKEKKQVHFPVCVFVDNSCLGSPFKRPCWAQSFNKQRPTKPLYTSFLHRLFSFHLSPLPLTHYTLSLHQPPTPTAIPLLVPINVQKLSSKNLNEFTIIASPVVTEVWLHLCLTFQTSSWLDPQWKRGFGDYLIVTQIESPSPSCAAMVVKRHIPLLFEWALRL